MYYKTGYDNIQDYQKQINTVIFDYFNVEYEQLRKVTLKIARSEILKGFIVEDDTIAFLKVNINMFAERSRQRWETIAPPHRPHRPHRPGLPQIRWRPRSADGCRTVGGSWKQSSSSAETNSDITRLKKSPWWSRLPGLLPYFAYRPSRASVSVDGRKFGQGFRPPWIRIVFYSDGSASGSASLVPAVPYCHGKLLVTDEVSDSGEVWAQVYFGHR